MRAVRDGGRERQPLPTMTKVGKGGSRSLVAIVLLLVAVAALVLYFEPESMFAPEAPGTATEGTASDEATASGSEPTPTVSSGTGDEVAAEEGQSLADQVADKIVERIEEKVAEASEASGTDSAAATSPLEELEGESDEELQATGSAEAPAIEAADSSADDHARRRHAAGCRDGDGGRGRGSDFG